MTDDRNGSWSGALNRNPKLYMTGFLIHGFQHDWYEEKLVDLTQAGKLTMHSVATCALIETPAPTTPAVSASDSVPIAVANGAAHVKVYLGGYWATMLIDTGANGMSISPSLAQALVNAGDAHYADRAIPVTLADGSVHEEEIIVVHKLVIGNHTLTDVPSTVTDQNTEMLLPLPVLTQIGRFTIDTKAGQLIFG
jgi:predicted aspartyl protease